MAARHYSGTTHSACHAMPDGVAGGAIAQAGTAVVGSMCGRAAGLHARPLAERPRCFVPFYEVFFDARSLVECHSDTCFYFK